MRSITAVVLLFMTLEAGAAEKTICVAVDVQGEDESPAPPRGDSGLPLGQDPISYLKRLLEYFVTHEKGYIAVDKACEERITVELYPLSNGWTAFARYSGNGREERVDYLYADELSQFAERAVLALLYDKPIGTTIQRDTVLRADSKRAVQRIHGTNHFVLMLGTQLRGGDVPTLHAGTTRDEVRVFSPIALGLGYRGKFESWGVEALGGISVGTTKSGLGQTGSDGHVDYGGNVSLALHFLRYLNPRGLSSWFLGAGGSFEVLWFYQIDPGSGSRSTLPSGGFDVDLVGGVEFMRASKVQFYLEGVLLVPAYVVENGDSPTPVKSWFPGAAITLGMLF
ncbi:MAG TPA: hypothetical protein VHB97_01780 [Polyangia bacterium]|jgi:hypothetical protein|nr:hypothetical protein [Polyangia bacterium]